MGAANGGDGIGTEAGYRQFVAFVTEASPVRRILSHMGGPAESSWIAPAHGLLARDNGPSGSQTGRDGTAGDEDMFDRPLH